MTQTRPVSFFFVVMIVLSIGNALGQTVVDWPADVVSEACDSNVNEVLNVEPVVTLGEGCQEFSITTVDSLLDVNCPQETRLERHWTVLACEDTLTHIQQISLLDQEPPFVSNPLSGNGHYCADGLDWLPVIQDNCDASLQASLTFQDTVEWCQGVISVGISVDVSDECGNQLDSTYTIYLHDVAPPVFSSFEDSILVGCSSLGDLGYPEFEDCGGLSLEDSHIDEFVNCGQIARSRTIALTDKCGSTATFNQWVHVVDDTRCGDGTVFDPESGLCVPVDTCVPLENACGPNTEWNEDLGLCVPQTIDAACYFDTDGSGAVGTNDLLTFLSSYGETCE